MTLLASERSLLIRNKFRSVLQLRIQNRRQSQINADSGLKSTSSPKKEQKDKSEALRLSDNVAGRHHQMPPSGVTAVTVQEKSESRASRQKKARRDLRGGIQDPPAPAEPKDKPHLENRAVSFPLPADVFEGDISSCSSSSSSSEQHVVPQPAASAFTSPSGLSDEQLLSDLSSVGPPLNHSPVRTHSGLALLPATEGIRPPTSVLLSESNSMATMSRPNGIFLISQTTPLLPKTARPPSPACSSSLTPAFNLNHLARSRKPRENKPKMKKLKYHQYIPPDQRGASGPGGGGAKPRSPPTQPLNPAGSQLLKQQQVCLQLQILQHQQQQQQQQFTVVPSREQNSSGALPLNPQPVPATTNHTPKDTNNASKLELLPANLVDLKVSELRQQLRKRGLPVSGTKPALLQRLRPFQLPPSRVTPVPLCQLGGGTEPLNPSHPLLAHHSPSSSCSSGDSPGSSPNQQMYIHDHGVPNGIVNVALNCFSNDLSVSLSGEQCGPINAVFLAPACTTSETPSPNLPMSSSSPLQCGTTWRTELGVEFDMKERMKCRARDSSANAVNEEPGCTRGNRETDGETEVLFTQVFCSQPCPSDMIDRDFELPVEITASPGQNSPGIRSLEEELQEAIQKVQLYPRQSIDDILDEPIVSVDSVNGSIDNSLIPSSPPPPQVDQSQKSQQHSKDSNFLPLCSSLLLELPPSPAVISPSHITPAPAPPPICTSPPLQSTRKSRKRRAQAMFDAAEILETLTSGLRPITPPAPPFAETDFGLDSDLNINRVLDLMIEQW
ncbi:myocardin isoform X2 [Phyllopteryx taeniolatus]|uniref:myocardin isoform X2 n=1 Tax=Phyllopteryx taeniolatus TaxID=161469 RepID=UPI002AD25CC7|nr:myocardin isoform X2 [Phyllopteryx taeniolatus]